MRWQVHVAQSAKWDLSDVANYIANTEKNKMKAFDLVDKAEETFSKLSELSTRPLNNRASKCLVSSR